MEAPPVRVPIEGGVLEATVTGSGDPVVLVQTALVADELLPLAERLRRRFRVVHHHRRGYAGSSPALQPGSVARDATDCARLLSAFAVDRVHVVGASYSAAVALQLAVDHPGVVRTLTLVEPPPVHGPADAAFRAANAALLADGRALGAEAAVDRFLVSLMGPDWREQLDGALPVSSAQVLRDSRTFLDVDIPALLAWPFDAATAARIRCPVLHVAGSDHGPLFDGVADLVRAWLPDADQVTIPGAGHDVALTHPDALGEAVVPFLARHPLG
ncbi:alpha/beta fold hydrolase [Blastococcus goldschmidtiae]|uniref:Alpha/beta hydrolase n=1 Tax=Blastococcus goldschmidtiae TaxID=3075546 RepID=A0ABU2K8C6_9ACTN|nr:alpha/beta hydrolase [Blastococcus sp. DSM 46792]MDT0276440.1 alpha/beta hydrolase [Blastococcus sp. DSM 46792]